MNLPQTTVGATTPVVRPKTPLAEAAQALSDICEMLDNGAEPSAAFVEKFQETRLDLADAVDRRISFFNLVEGALEAARETREEWDKRVQQLKSLQGKMKEVTIGIMTAEPNLPYQGKLGRLALQKNPASLRLEFEGKELTKDMIGFFNISAEFIKTTYEVKTAAVKDVLKNGGKIAWAFLDETGQHLRIRK